jgi:hypothetical protein
MMIKREIPYYVRYKKCQYTMKPPEPNIDPVAKPPSLNDSYVIKRSSPLAVLYIKSAGKWVLMNLQVLMLSMVVRAHST